MTKCTGIGKAFGHKLEAVYDTKIENFGGHDVSIMNNSLYDYNEKAEYDSNQFMVEPALEIVKTSSTTYMGHVCTRCGLVVNNEKTKNV